MPKDSNVRHLNFNGRAATGDSTHIQSCNMIVSDWDGKRIIRTTVHGKTYNQVEVAANAELTRLRGLYPNARIFREYL